MKNIVTFRLIQRKYEILFQILRIKFCKFPFVLIYGIQLAELHRKKTCLDFIKWERTRA